MAPRPYVAVHPLGNAIAQRVRWLPVSPPSPRDLDDRTVSHKPVATGIWDADSESHLLAIIDVEVTARSNHLEGIQFKPVVLWEHAGAFTDLQVADVGSGEDVLVVTGSSLGCITLSRLLVPRMPGTIPEDITLVGMEGSSLEAWAVPHSGAVSSVDVHPQTKAVLTAGADGRICILDPNSCPSGATVTPFKSSTGYVSYTNSRWADSHAFVSSSSAGGMDLWDVRQGPKPAHQYTTSRPLEHQILWLHCHPSRPDQCTSGANNGMVTVWDLRFTAEPVACTSPDEKAGPVWEVCFDTYSPPSISRSASRESPSGSSVMYCTQGGVLQQTESSGQHCTSKQQQQQRQVNDLILDSSHAAATMAAAPLYSSSSAVNSFDIEATRGEDVVCVTDAHALVYIAR